MYNWILFIFSQIYLITYKVFGVIRHLGDYYGNNGDYRE